MKLSFWDILTGILMFAGFGVVLVFANIFIDPYTILNPFPPPTLQPTLKIPTSTPTLRMLPDIWTATPTGRFQTTTLLPSLTPVASKTGFTLAPTNTFTPAPTLTPAGTNTPTRTNTPLGGRTNTPTRTRTPTRTSTSSSFAVTSVQNIAASPSSYTGACPKSFAMSATIYYTNDGTITYYWIRSSDNAHLGSGSYDLDGSSPDNFTATLSLGTSGYVNTSTYYLYIDHPNHQQFGGVEIPIVCTTSLITSNGGGATASISVAENDTAVTDVDATDPDAGASLTYSVSGTDAGDFSIDGATGVLTFNPAPDYENPTDDDTDNEYLVTVEVTDGTNTDTQDLTVTVTNEAPAITSDGGGSTAAVSVAENTTVVTTVAATDPAGGTVTYSISGGVDQAFFTIDGGTGALAFSAAPDWDVPADSDGNNEYIVEVTASDGDLTDTQEITVTVTDAGD